MTTMANESEAGTAPRTRTRRVKARRARPQILTGLTLTPDQLTAALKSVAEGAAAATTTLTPLVPGAFLTGKVIDGAALGSTEFVLSMADLKERFPKQLGHLPGDPAAMRGNIALAVAAQAAASPLRMVLSVLDNIANYATKQGLGDARVLYQHATVSAPLNPALDEAIAPVREARARRSKKGATTRVRNERAQQPKAPLEAQPEAPTVATTVTTTQR